MNPEHTEAGAKAIEILVAVNHPLVGKITETIAMWNLQQRDDDKVRAYLNRVLLNPVSHLYRINDHDRAEYARAKEFFQEAS